MKGTYAGDRDRNVYHTFFFFGFAPPWLEPAFLSPSPPGPTPPPLPSAADPPPASPGYTKDTTLLEIVPITILETKLVLVLYSIILTCGYLFIQLLLLPKLGKLFLSRCFLALLLFPFGQSQEVLRIKVLWFDEFRLKAMGETSK